jgi:hypothetical protein
MEKKFIKRLGDIIRNEKPSSDLDTIILFVDVAHHTTILMGILERYFPDGQRTKFDTILINGFTVKVIPNYATEKTWGFKFIPIWCDL